MTAIAHLVKESLSWANKSSDDTSEHRIEKCDAIKIKIKTLP